MNKLSGNKPVITVVTVVYNGAETIENTILSCIHQTYQEIEYIIVDGNSKDNTVEIISKYSSKIACFISEPDNGIYDAMNKAIEAATGDWIIFMNSGDLFHDLNVLSDISEFIVKNSLKEEIIYGNTIYKYPSVLLKISPKPIDSILHEMTFCHQSCFVAMNLIKHFPFETKYKFAADYNMFYEFYKLKMNFKYFERTISIFNQEEGATLRNYKSSLKEFFTIQGFGDTFRDKCIYYSRLSRMGIGLFVKKILPLKIKDYIFKNKNRKYLYTVK